MLIENSLGCGTESTETEQADFQLAIPSTAAVY